MQPQTFWENIQKIGGLEPGTNFNKYINAWHLPLGIPIMYTRAVHEYWSHDLNRLRLRYMQGHIGKVEIEVEEDGTIFFELNERM
jgi:hypothetical protein